MTIKTKLFITVDALLWRL